MAGHARRCNYRPALAAREYARVLGTTCTRAASCSAPHVLSGTPLRPRNATAFLSLPRQMGMPTVSESHSGWAYFVWPAREQPVNINGGNSPLITVRKIKPGTVNVEVTTAVAET